MSRGGSQHTTYTELVPTNHTLYQYAPKLNSENELQTSRITIRS